MKALHKADVIFNDYGDYWLDNFVDGIKSSGTLAGSKLVIREFGAYAGFLPMREIRTIHGIQYRNSQLRKGNMNGTINNKIGILKAMFRDAMAEGVVPYNVMIAVPKLVNDRREKRPLMKSELSELDMILGFDTVSNAIRFDEHTGLRRAECMGIPLANIDLEHRLIMIDQQLQYIMVSEISPASRRGFEPVIDIWA